MALVLLAGPLIDGLRNCCRLYSKYCNTQRISNNIMSAEELRRASESWACLYGARMLLPQTVNPKSGEAVFSVRKGLPPFALDWKTVTVSADEISIHLDEHVPTHHPHRNMLQNIHAHLTNDKN